MLEKLERQNAFLSRPCSLKEYIDEKIYFIFFLNPFGTFHVTRFEAHAHWL
jgi:hypothetical protein